LTGARMTWGCGLAGDWTSVRQWTGAVLFGAWKEVFDEAPAKHWGTRLGRGGCLNQRPDEQGIETRHILINNTAGVYTIV